MNATTKKFLYIPWVLLLFGVAAILTLFEPVLSKGRKILGFKQHGQDPNPHC